MCSDLIASKSGQEAERAGNKIDHILCGRAVRPSGERAGPPKVVEPRVHVRYVLTLFITVGILQMQNLRSPHTAWHPSHL
eukprot:6008238-Prymnesium_polylepis.2